MEWKYHTAATDGNCKLFGVNIFNYKWQNTGKKAEVTDPRYNVIKVFSVWKVEIDDIEYEFAAGEFSNSVWGFYLPGK